MKIFVCLCFALSFMDLCLCGDAVNITAEPGKNVNLPCRADRNGKVSVVRLTRNDLEPEFVFLYRDGHIDVDHQNPQYSGRTELSRYSIDRKVNVTINNVSVNDTGLYECSVRTGIRSNTRSKRAVLERTFIHLHVAPGRGYIGLVAGLVVVIVAVVALAGFFWKKRNVSPPQDETAEALQAE